jgi:hypothetical protein
MSFFDNDEPLDARYLGYKPGDRVLHNEQEYEILAFYKDGDTDVTLVATSGFAAPGEMFTTSHSRLVRARLKDLRHAL